MGRKKADPDAPQLFGRKFKYEACQCEAIETLVYLFEVAKVRRPAGSRVTSGGM
jgi:hypothetical protein